MLLDNYCSSECKYLLYHRWPCTYVKRTSFMSAQDGIWIKKKKKKKKKVLSLQWNQFVAIYISIAAMKSVSTLSMDANSRKWNQSPSIGCNWVCNVKRRLCDKSIWNFKLKSLLRESITAWILFVISASKS